MTATTTTARIDPQTQEELMRQAGIWIEHSTLIEDDLPARPLAAVQAEKHQLDRYTQLVADRAAARDSKCLAQIEEPAALAGTTIEQYARMFNAACEALGQVSDCLGINSDIDPGAEPIIAAIEQLRAGKTHPVLDDNWKARMLDGRAPERDEMGLGDHPELPWLDEGMMPRSFFAALGLELAHTSAEDQLDGDVLGAMSEAVNWSRWMPTAPKGDGWKLVSIFDTEDGPVAWWLRELPEAEDGTTTIRILQAEVEKLKARIARAGAAPAAVAGPTDADLRKALQFYANGEHFILSERDTSWDTVSGEPQNYWCDEAGTATVEDGTIAKMALAGQPIDFEEDDAAPALEAPAAPNLRQTRDKAGILHYLTPEQMAEEIVRLDARLAAAPQAPAAPTAVATQVIENLLQLARIVNTAVEDWGETKEDDTLHVIFHKEQADKLEEILEFFDALPDASPEEGVILSGPSRAARVLRAMAAPAAPAVDAFTHAELLEIQRAVEEFADCNETDVDYDLLMRAAQAGYLECTQFHVLNQSALDLDTVAAAQAKEGGEA